MTYKGYVVATATQPKPAAYVYEPHAWREGRSYLYRAPSYALALKWIDAYRLGEHWAVEACK
jgi:hypothetical protein